MPYGRVFQTKQAKAFINVIGNKVYSTITDQRGNLLDLTNPAHFWESLKLCIQIHRFSERRNLTPIWDERLLN